MPKISNKQQTNESLASKKAESAKNLRRDVSSLKKRLANVKKTKLRRDISSLKKRLENVKARNLQNVEKVKGETSSSIGKKTDSLEELSKAYLTNVYKRATTGEALQESVARVIASDMDKLGKGNVSSDEPLDILCYYVELEQLPDAVLINI